MFGQIRLYEQCHSLIGYAFWSGSALLHSHIRKLQCSVRMQILCIYLFIYRPQFSKSSEIIPKHVQFRGNTIQHVKFCLFPPYQVALSQWLSYKYVIIMIIIYLYFVSITY